MPLNSRLWPFRVPRSPTSASKPVLQAYVADETSELDELQTKSCLEFIASACQPAGLPTAPPIRGIRRIWPMDAVERELLELIAELERFEAAAGKSIRIRFDVPLVEQLDPDCLAAVKRWAEDRDRH